jgi:hypothetical protein
MFTRFMQDNFLGAVVILLGMGLCVGTIGVQAISLYLACIHLIGMGGGING